MTPQEMIEKAIDLIEDMDNWCVGTRAVNYKGEDVGASDADACRWCAMGALERVAFENGETSYTWAHNALCKAAKDKYNHSITGVNDLLGHEAILNCMREAAAA